MDKSHSNIFEHDKAKPPENTRGFELNHPNTGKTRGRETNGDICSIFSSLKRDFIAKNTRTKLTRLVDEIYLPFGKKYSIGVLGSASPLMEKIYLGVIWAFVGVFQRHLRGWWVEQTT